MQQRIEAAAAVVVPRQVPAGDIANDEEAVDRVAVERQPIALAAEQTKQVRLDGQVRGRVVDLDEQLRVRLVDLRGDRDAVGADLVHFLLANGQVELAATFAEGSGDDSVNAVGLGPVDDSRIDPLAAVIVLGELLSRRIEQSQERIERLLVRADHVDDVDLAGEQPDLEGHLACRTELARQRKAGTDIVHHVVRPIAGPAAHAESRREAGDREQETHAAAHGRRPPELLCVRPSTGLF